jgi:DNA-directed RNA polymerase specialized sigma24 family protein
VIPLLARREERAFERLYRKHVGDVYRYALVVLRDHLDAEEVTQTTFLNAYRGFRQGDRALLRLNSLLAIVHDICRRRGGRPRLDMIDVGEDDGQRTVPDVPRALGLLPFDQRAVLVMREVEGRSYAEIAQILALSVGAVEALIFHARQALREELEGSLACHQAELAVSRQLDDRLARKEKRRLRAHLCSCEECHAFARSQRTQRAALRALAAVPLPETLRSFFGSSPRRLALRGGRKFSRSWTSP